MSRLLDLDLPPAAIHWNRRILERMRLQATGRIGAAVMANMEIESWQDPVADSLVFRLSTELLREKLLEDETDVPFTADVPVQVPARPARRSALGAFALAIGLTAAGIAVGSLVVVGAAMLVALLATWTLTERLDDMPTVAHVEGAVTVKASYFHTFPENTVPLPSDYGHPYRFVELATSAHDLYADA